MNKKLIMCFLLVLTLVAACKEKKNQVNEASKMVEEPLKDISELTYPEIFYLLHNEEEYGMDFHGDLFGQEAASFATFITEANSECGEAVAIKSSNKEATIQVAVKTTFSFPNNPSNELVRLYKVKPEATIPVGHNKLCYNGDEYAINREIVSAGFSSE
jgi:hypothetical protein